MTGEIEIAPGEFVFGAPLVASSYGMNFEFMLQRADLDMPEKQV